MILERLSVHCLRFDSHLVFPPRVNQNVRAFTYMFDILQQNATELSVLKFTSEVDTATGH
jgi:uncharacterized UBP type Zn finger protein